jgi:threonine/homoserine/homoserine lactone efflux protein
MNRASSRPAPALRLVTEVNVPDNSALAVFIAAALVLLLIPGPAVLYIVARSINQGRKAGFVSILGLAAGNLVHVFTVSFGLSALLLTSTRAFAFVKLLGAGYLVYLGIRAFLDGRNLVEEKAPGAEKYSRIFWQGIVVNILNPKSALFFFAFLPQFVNPARGSIVFQMFFLGLLFILLGIVTDLIYAMLAGTLAYRLRRSPALLRGKRYFAGSVYVALGIGTALSGARLK